MAAIDRIVSVAIVLRTAGVRQRTFDQLMLMGVHTGVNRVDIITESSQLLTGYGITATDDLYKAAQVAFSQEPRPEKIYIGRRVAAEAVNVALTACAAANNDWYGFSEVSHAEADLTLAAAWAEANTKLFLTALSDVDITATTGIEPATALKTSNYFRTAWWYNIDPDQFPEVAIAAIKFQTPPGGETWANQTMAAVTAPPLSETAYTNITAKNGNTFEAFRNLSITQNGIVAGGEWIDIIRFRDWLCEEIRVNVFNSFVNTRIPYTDTGIAIIRQAITKAMDLGLQRGGIAPREKHPTEDRIVSSYTITVPSALNVSQADKAARVLNDVIFTARLAGAIHAVNIIGSLVYSDIG